MEETNYKIVDGGNVKTENTRGITCHLEKAMIPSKVVYFLAKMKDSCYWPFMVLFLIDIGLTPTQAGLVNGVCFIGAIIGTPTWGMIADQRQAHKTVTVILCCFSILILCSQVAVPFIFIKPGNYNATYSNATANVLNNYPQSKESMFYFLLIINLLALFFDGGILSFVDSTVLTKINSLDSKPDYGLQRLFGGFGYGVGVLISGAIIDLFPAKVFVSSYSAIFYIYFITVTFLGINCWYLQKDVSFSRALTNSSTRKVLWEHVRKWKNLFFFSTVFVLGLMNGFYTSFFAVYLHFLKTPTVLVGVTFAVAALSGLVVIAFSTKVIQFCGGTWKSLAVALFVWGLRFLSYYFIENPWFVFPVQVASHGFGFGLSLIAIISHVKQISPSCILTSMCSLANVLFFYVGIVIASIFGGQLYETFGVHLIFLALSFLSFFWGIIVILFLIGESYCSRKPVATLELKE